MSRGTKQLSQNGNSSTTINGGTQQQSPQNNSRRVNKTWCLRDYLRDFDAVDIGNKEGNKSKHMVAQRKASLQDATSKSAVNGIIEGQRKARSKQRFVGNQMIEGYQRANSSSLSDGKSTPARKEQQNDKVLNAKDQNQDQNQIDVKKLNAKGPNGKENYWYYDRLSDGYYYEHNGTRGWRKNNAKMEAVLRNMEDSQKWEQQIIQQKNQQKKISLNDCTNNKAINPLPSLLFAHKLSKLIPQSNGSSTALNNAFNNNNNNSPMAINGYDNDGYFYEMGSVDGWRRRQPGATPSGATSPFQTKRGGSAMSTAQVYYDQQTPRRKPLQYQAYQQPAPHLGGFDLQEVAAAVLSKQQQNNNHHHHQSNNNCCGRASPAVACCCLTAAIAAQLVLKQQEIMANKRENKIKSSEIYSLIDNLTTKGLDFGELNTNAALDRLTSDISQPLDLGTNWQIPERSKWDSPIINEEKSTSMTKTTNEINNGGLAVGSFENPIDIMKFQSLQSYTGVDSRILNDFSVFL